MNSKYELWYKVKEVWVIHARSDDLEELRKKAKHLMKLWGIDVKIYAVERFEQPIYPS